MRALHLTQWLVVSLASVPALPPAGVSTSPAKRRRHLLVACWHSTEFPLPPTASHTCRVAGFAIMTVRRMSGLLNRLEMPGIFKTLPKGFALGLRAALAEGGIPNIPKGLAGLDAAGVA